MSPDRRVLVFYSRCMSLLTAMSEGEEINFEDQERQAESLRHEITTWLEYVRINTEPSVTQPDIAFPRPHVCNSSRCCNRLEAR